MVYDTIKLITLTRGDTVKEKELLRRMAQGELYSDHDPLLCEIRDRTRLIMEQYRNLVKERDPAAKTVLRRLLGATGKQVSVHPTAVIDIGAHVFLGDRVRIGAQAVLYACAPIRLEDDVQICSGVQFFTADHSLVGR